MAPTVTSAATSWKAAAAVHPSVWGDFFINYIPEPLQISDEKMLEKVNQLKGEVSGLFEACKNVVEKMDLVDVLQHLGIDHHFKEQIATTLSSIHKSEFNSSSLHEVALRFRLLRQHGFWVSAGEFDKFKHEDGSFSNDIINDPKGLLSLYNAANLLTHNEGALEEALLFARHHLELMKSSLKSPLAEQVERALKIPLPRTLKRIEVVSYIPEYSVEKRYNPTLLLELAKLDFNLLQRLHQKELKKISQWWKDLFEDIRLEYVRDRIVECYFWAYSVYYEQEHARARMILVRLFMLTSLLDDTYDDHATLEESRELTKAIERWDESDISLLPEYMKKLFLKILRNFKEFEDELEPHEKYRIAYARKGFQLISKSYLQEAEWSHHDYIPSFNDHVNVSTISAGGQLMCTGILVGMRDVATKEAFEWTLCNNDAIRACAVVSRLMDDMADFKRGRNKMDVATSVECYMEEHNVTSEVALAKISSFVDDAWKTLNHAAFEHRALLPVLQRVTNFAMSMMIIFFDQRDGYTNSKELKETLKSQFVKHIPL